MSKGAKRATRPSAPAPGAPSEPPGTGLRIVERPGAVRFDVLVAARSSREAIGPLVGEALKVAVKAPPVDGEANAAVIAVIARALGVRRSEVRIVAGPSSKRKTVEVTGASRAAVLGLLG